MNRIYLAAAMMAASCVFASFVQAATMLPAIGGTVFQDLDGNNNVSVGEQVANVLVRLYQDDGNGVFDRGRDIQIGTGVTTGPDGTYSFEGLDPSAGYFAERPEQIVLGNNLPAELSGLIKPGEASLIIDSFENNQFIIANSTTPIVTSTLNNPLSNVLGGERDLFAQILEGPGEIALRVNGFGVEVNQYDTTSGVSGRGIVTWDGADGSASPTPSLGLGGVDLTQGGKNSGFIMRLGSDASGGGEPVRIRIFKNDSAEFSEGSIAFPTTGGTASRFAFLMFDEITGNVTPDEVNAIQMLIGAGARSIDAQITQLGAIGMKINDFQVVPEPSSIIAALIALLGLLCGGRRKISAC